jgi:RNA polymerase sigma-70 factor (ECF subfamily)
VESTEDAIVALIPRLRRYARALVGDADRADDLVQDCLARAWGRLGRWRRGSDLRAWLFTIAHNLHANECRRAARAPDWVALDDCGDLAGSSSAGVEAAVVLRDLQGALAALPVEQREVLLLVSLEGMRYEEVAAILAVPVGTVMSRLHRARERLRRHLAGERPRGLRSVK